MKSLIKLVSSTLLISTIANAADQWKPIWDGKTLAGWHVIGKGKWEIKDGAIHGTQTKDEAEYGHLVSDRSFSDFTVRLKFKALKGNSAFYFRVEEKGASGVTGYQAEIDAANSIGGIYETNGRAWIVQPTAEQVATWFKPNEWNDMTVTAKGGDIVVHINGKKSAEVSDDPGRKEGNFALQLHGGQDVDVWFKDIEILSTQ